MALDAHVQRIEPDETAHHLRPGPTTVGQVVQHTSLVLLAPFAAMYVVLITVRLPRPGLLVERGSRDCACSQVGNFLASAVYTAPMARDHGRHDGLRRGGRGGRGGAGVAILTSSSCLRRG